MQLFRIAHERYTCNLTASGRANRWNRENQFVLYGASSRSLAMLELLVHRSGIYPSSSYKMMIIQVMGEFSTLSLDRKTLPDNWRSMAGYPALQALGTDWYAASNDLLLEIPSAIVPQESNYVLNTRHGNFVDCVKLLDREGFYWDERLLR